MRKDGKVEVVEWFEDEHECQDQREMGDGLMGQCKRVPLSNERGSNGQKKNSGKANGREYGSYLVGFGGGTRMRIPLINGSLCF